MRYKLTIAYDGTNYAGWQIQPNATAIQEVLQEKASKILQEECIIVAAGRTDAGVHADAQVAHIDSEKTLEPGTFLLSLNSLLPKISASPMSKKFPTLSTPAFLPNKKPTPTLSTAPKFSTHYIASTARTSALPSTFPS